MTITNSINHTQGSVVYPTSATQGDILYASATNTISDLAKDTNATRYLSNTGTSNAPAWAQVNLANGVTGALPQANGGSGQTNFSGNRVLIQSQTANNSAATLSFTTGISGYSYYEVEMYNYLPATAGSTLVMTFSVDGGSNYLSTGYYLAGRIQSSAASAAGANSQTNAASFLLLNSIANTATHTGSLTLKIYNLASAVNYQNIIFTSCYEINGTVEITWVSCTGRILAGTAVNAIQFATSSGNMVSGVFNLYGVV